MTDEERGAGYSVRLIEERLPDGRYTWFAYHPSLPGCHAVGVDMTEATSNLERTREAWLAWADKENLPVPPLEEQPKTSILYAPRVEVPSAEVGGSEGSYETIKRLAKV